LPTFAIADLYGLDKALSEPLWCIGQATTQLLADVVKRS
jgi:hypothetical protein